MSGNETKKPMTAAEQLRRQRQRRVLIRFLVFVVLPTFLATVYYAFIASDQYESVALFTIQSAEGPSAGGVEFLLGTLPGSTAGRDVLIVQEHVESRAMLAHLRKEHGFDEHYQSTEHDFLSRLSKDADSEEVYKYFRKRVHVEHDAASGVLTLKVRAFTPEDAQRFANAILAASEQMVNRMSDEARLDRMRLATDEVEKAERRLADARKQLLEVQREGEEFDPLESARTASAVRGTLEAQLAEARAELSALAAVMHPNAPKVQEQRRKVAALSAQVDRERSKLVGDSERTVSETLALFEPRILEKEFAEQTYRSAISSLELARIEASRQHRYLVTVADPSAPDARTHPEKLREILTVFLASFMLLGVGSLLIASVKEHANL